MNSRTLSLCLLPLLFNIGFRNQLSIVASSTRVLVPKSLIITSWFFWNLRIHIPLDFYHLHSLLKFSFSNILLEFFFFPIFRLNFLHIPLNFSSTFMSQIQPFLILLLSIILDRRASNVLASFRNVWLGTWSRMSSVVIFSSLQSL